MTDDEMTELTALLPTKSAKIRALADSGVARADIARFLDIRYQHVRNVLVAPRPERASELNAAPPSRAASGESREARGLSIEDAKRGLAVRFGVSIDAIEITIRG